MLSPGLEQRKSRRQPLRQAAWISLGDHCPLVRCVLWDISDCGARLMAARSPADLPDRFILLLSEQSVQRNCRVIWRNDRFVGVQFVQA